MAKNCVSNNVIAVNFVFGFKPKEDPRKQLTVSKNMKMGMRKSGTQSNLLLLIQYCGCSLVKH